MKVRIMTNNRRSFWLERLTLGLWRRISGYYRSVDSVKHAIDNARVIPPEVVEEFDIDFPIHVGSL